MNVRNIDRGQALMAVANKWTYWISQIWFHSFPPFTITAYVYDFTPGFTTTAIAFDLTLGFSVGHFPLIFSLYLVLSLSSYLHLLAAFASHSHNKEFAVWSLCPCLSSSVLWSRVWNWSRITAPDSWRLYVDKLFAIHFIALFSKFSVSFFPYVLIVHNDLSGSVQLLG